MLCLAEERRGAGADNRRCMPRQQRLQELRGVWRGSRRGVESGAAL